MNLKNTLLGACFAASTAAMPAAFARVDIAVQIGVPPPAPVVEVVAVGRPGYVWVPGYWAWHQDRHVWIRGRYVVERPGYYWVADRWVSAGPHWRHERGYWAPHPRGRGHGYAKGHNR
ncbi:MAG: YXWGXW repeat-containing protein [Burkholderiales bacterium]